MFDNIYVQVGLVVTILVVAFAFVKGDEPERIAGAAFVLLVVASLVTPDSGPAARWGQIGWDLILAAVLGGLAWHSRRTWLIWASAFQSMIVTGHILVLSNIKPPADAFAAVNNMANYGLLISLAVGTFWAWQERRAAGLEK